MSRIFPFLSALALTALSVPLPSVAQEAPAAPAAAPETKPAAVPDWIALFNGTNLDGWTIKIAKRPLGENYADTFRVEDGILKVSYDKYPKFDAQYGHLFTNLAYSHYLLRLEYRFTGVKVPDAPGYTIMNR